jgi:hypothetical protein
MIGKCGLDLMKPPLWTYLSVKERFNQQSQLMATLTLTFLGSFQAALSGALVTRFRSEKVRAAGLPGGGGRAAAQPRQPVRAALA